MTTTDLNHEGIIFPITLSGGRVVTLRNMPHELSRTDAERISRVVLALAAIEEEQEEVGRV